MGRHHASAGKSLVNMLQTQHSSDICCNWKQFWSKRTGSNSKHLEVIHSRTCVQFLNIVYNVCGCLCQETAKNLLLDWCANVNYSSSHTMLDEFKFCNHRFQFEKEFYSTVPTVWHYRWIFSLLPARVTFRSWYSIPSSCAGKEL